MLGIVRKLEPEHSIIKLLLLLAHFKRFAQIRGWSGFKNCYNVLSNQRLTNTGSLNG
jgi:hypothetical protein